MKKLLISFLFISGIFHMGYCDNSKVEVLGDMVIAKDSSIPQSQGNLEVEGVVSVGKGAIQLKPNGDVLITGRVILKNPDGGISMGAYGKPLASVDVSELTTSQK